MLDGLALLVVEAVEIGKSGGQDGLGDKKRSRNTVSGSRCVRNGHAGAAAATGALVWIVPCQEPCMTEPTSQTPPPPASGAPQPASQEAPPHPAQDPTRKTDATIDPTADDPGNGAD
jgi:hypothetical protein